MENKAKYQWALPLHQQPVPGKMKEGIFSDNVFSEARNGKALLFSGSLHNASFILKKKAFLLIQCENTNFHY